MGCNAYALSSAQKNAKNAGVRATPIMHKVSSVDSSIVRIVWSGSNDLRTHAPKAKKTLRKNRVPS